MSDPISVTSEFDPQTSTHAVKIAVPSLELNVRIPSSDVHKLEQVCTASWDARGSVRIGEVVGVPAFWCTDQATHAVDILIGGDDETWDICVTLPPRSVEMVIEEIAACSKSSGR
jgi:hypothetical protein